MPQNPSSSESNGPRGAERFAGRTAVVTGAAQGIGRAICERLLGEGAAGVVTVDLQPHDLGERCVSVVGDVSEADTAQRAVDGCLERFGRIDLMAAHAGIAEPRPLLETDDEVWRRHMAVNVDGVFFCVRAAARAMVSAGQGGAIVGTASINAWHVEETMAAYNVSKAAVHALVRSAAIDLGRHGIRVNAVAPGVVDTAIARLVVHNPDLAPAYLRTIPLGRFGQPRDIADAVLFLASGDAAYITGQMLVIDGGQTLGITGDLETADDEKGG
ncbi:MAG TPA: SDR family oxidoreductase [Solirubrobacteraceae bacterium]|jgi:NAD(P)-dependent dehydrogenase (short-subunit alcohol dehydrogenase family)|nr:SDR family oxidoreductase [Solirubrobacteraceae bacterium]